MQEDSYKPWGIFAELALSWANAFLSEEEYLVLVGFLHQKKWTMDSKSFQDFIQEGDQMTVGEMRQAAMNLQDCGILKLDEQRNLNFPNNANNNFKTISINDNLVQQLEKQWRFFEERNQIELKELQKQESSKSNKTCSICGSVYSLLEIHLQDMKKCKKIGCEQGVLKDYIEDDYCRKSFTIEMQNALQKLRTLIDECKNRNFPTVEDIEQPIKKIEIQPNLRIMKQRHIGQIINNNKYNQHLDVQQIKELISMQKKNKVFQMQK